MNLCICHGSFCVGNRVGIEKESLWLKYMSYCRGLDNYQCHGHRALM